MEDFQLHLYNDWGLCITDDSKALLSPRHSDDIAEELLARGWTKPTMFKALGRFYTDNGGTEAAWEIVKPRLWRAFWANCGRKELHCSPKYKVSLMRRTVEPILRFHVTGWPFNLTRAKQIDSLQAAMVAKFIRLTPTPTESASEFFNRRSMHAARMIGREKRWSVLWANGIVSWHEHVLRHPELSAHQLLKFKSESWLQIARTTMFLSSSSTGTNTRASRGKPCTRWETGVEDARRFLRS